MKISYNLVVADGFEFVHHKYWPTPVGDQTHINALDIEFTPTSGDNMKDADKALNDYIKANYPNKDYRILYWSWC